jgi:hypothetical protein
MYIAVAFLESIRHLGTALITADLVEQNRLSPPIISFVVRVRCRRARRIGGAGGTPSRPVQLLHARS